MLTNKGLLLLAVFIALNFVSHMAIAAHRRRLRNENWRLRNGYGAF